MMLDPHILAGFPVIFFMSLIRASLSSRFFPSVTLSRKSSTDCWVTFVFVSAIGDILRLIIGRRSLSDTQFLQRPHQHIQFFRQGEYIGSDTATLYPGGRRIDGYRIELLLLEDAV